MAVDWASTFRCARRWHCTWWCKEMRVEVKPAIFVYTWWVLDLVRRLFDLSSLAFAVLWKFCSTYVGILLTTQVPLSEASYSKNACSHQKKYADRHDILEHIRIQRRNIKEKSDGWSLPLLTRTFLQRFMPASSEIQAASSGLVENSYQRRI